MKKHILFLLVMGTQIQFAQFYDFNSLPDGYESSKIGTSIAISIWNTDPAEKQLSFGLSEANKSLEFPGFNPAAVNLMLKNSNQTEGFSGENTGTSFWEEAGYIAAMETAFTGLSYFASQNTKYGTPIVGGFDVMMGVSGILNAANQKSTGKTLGYILLSAGFIAKAVFNFSLADSQSSSTRFWTNFAGFNFLVFTGYFLDSLE